MIFSISPSVKLSAKYWSNLSDFNLTSLTFLTSAGIKASKTRDLEKFPSWLNFFMSEIFFALYFACLVRKSSSFFIIRMFECNYEDKQLQKDLVSKIRKNLGPAMFSSEGDVKWTMQAFLCSISPGLEYKVKSKL